MTVLTGSERDWMERARALLAHRPENYFQDDRQAYDRAAKLELFVEELLTTLERLDKEDELKFGADQLLGGNDWQTDRQKRQEEGQ